jgi:hypothetical protein
LAEFFALNPALRAQCHFRQVCALSLSGPTSFVMVTKEGRLARRARGSVGSQ